MPGLAVGLHVVLVHGTPVLPPERIPDLVDRDGRFLTDLVAAGVRFFFRPGARSQLEAEIRAQFERFASTGLPLDHVDAQCHMHVHPTVLATLLRVGREYGMRAMRLPREPVIASLAGDGSGAGKRIANAAVTEPWLALMRARARRAGVRCNDHVFGMNDPGQMTEERVLRLLDALPDGTTEIFFHPATGPFAGADAGTESYAWRAELDALTSPKVREAIERHATSITYGELASDTGYAA
jgi:hopanoid biosynthesis associated protein HpnK